MPDESHTVTASDNVYLRQIHAALPRLLALFDMDRTNATYGTGDRFRWSWKLIDFSNGAYQGACHGLARLLHHDLLPDGISEDRILARIDAMFAGLASIQRGNGSVDQAFPYESSFALTGFVAFDMLSAIELLGDRINDRTRREYLDIVRPMIGFLHKADEVHGFISNHLAGTAAALLKWSRLSGETGAERGRELLSRIADRYCDEGWFLEYQGFDPGYQTLCTHYLADIFANDDGEDLREPLAQSLAFLAHFAHPDGSFGGHYGSRATRFYYPSGVEALATLTPAAAGLSAHMRTSIAENRVVTLAAMDDTNLVPMFNSYCWAAALHAQSDNNEMAIKVPCAETDRARLSFPEAGIWIENADTHYTVVSWKKGGVCCHFDKRDGTATIDTGAVARAGGTLWTSQSFSDHCIFEESEDALTIRAEFVALQKPLPMPHQFVILRVLNLTIMRMPLFNGLVKRLLVRMLITRRRRTGQINVRTITLRPSLTIGDQCTDHRAPVVYLDDMSPFASFHMASQGYWQRQDDT